MSILNATHLKKYYGKDESLVKALDDVNVSVENGQFVAIIGTSGSGKSTLLNMLGGLDIPTEGSVQVENKNLEKLTEEQLTVFRRQRIGFIFQNYNLIPYLTAYENMVLPVRLDGKIEDKKFLKEIVHFLELDGKLSNYPSHLSGGQQQRVLIARALCATRELLILDEPITGLDPMAIQDFYSMIRKLNREDKVAIIMVSHDLRNAVEEANKILHLQKQVLFYGPAHDYMNSKAAGHFFHEKEQGECLPTAACHMAKNGDGLENNEQKCSCGHTHAHSHQKIEGGNTHERA